jgi:hypothetical protein
VGEAGIAGARVVDGDQRAGGAQAVQVGFERGVIVDGEVLGELDDESAQVTLVGPDLADDRVRQHLRAHVDGEEAVAREAAAFGEGRAQGGGLQFGAASVFAGGGEPRRRAAHRVALEPGQRLVADHGPAGQVDNRLVDRVQTDALDGGPEQLRPAEVGAGSQHGLSG